MNLFLLFLLITFPIVSNGFPWFNKKSQPNFHRRVIDYDDRLIGPVAGGRDADPRGMPIYAPNRGYNYPIPIHCNGVFISNRWVLTAARCASFLSNAAFLIYDTADTYLAFRVNDYFKRDITSEEYENFKRNTIQVEKRYIHPKYNPKTRENDIALLLLSVPVNANIRPICLPEPGEDETFYGLNRTIAGWGISDSKPREPSHMQIISLPIIKYDSCQKIYAKRKLKYNKPIITESVLCAGYLEGGKDSCFGYSGGPLMVKIENH